MRFARPPLFMSSPASMKNGSAISRKLSAPLMMFWATIWESNIPIVLISATPHMISAKAIGMPRAIAPSNESAKTAMVISCAPATLSRSGLNRCWAVCRRTSMLLRFPDGHHVGFACLPRDHPEQVVEQQDAGRYAKDDADEIEDAERQTRRRRAVVDVDDGLAPAPRKQKPVGIQHQAIVDDEADPFSRGRQHPDQAIDAQMRVLAHGDDGAQKSQPHQQPARQFLRNRNSGVEAIAKHDAMTPLSNAQYRSSIRSMGAVWIWR